MRIAASRERVRQKKIDDWAAQIVERCTGVAQIAARDGESATKVYLVDEEIEEGTFWLEDGRLVREMEGAAGRAVAKLGCLGFMAEYVRERTQGFYDEGDLAPSIWYFKPIITLSGW